MSTTATDLTSLLRQRGPLLARLVAAPTDAPTLTEDVSVSRSTVDRALAAFDEWGLISLDADPLEPTLFARLVFTIYDDFEADVTAMVAHEAGETPLWRTAAERTDALELIADRLDLLKVVQTPGDKRTLVAELSYARSTVDRVVRELELAGVIQRTADGYTTTPIGQRLVTRYRTLLAVLADLLAARDLLTHLPAECALPPALFIRADIERTKEVTSYRLLAGVRDRLDTADRIRLVLPALPNPQLLDVCHQRVVCHGATLELIADPSLADTLTSEFPGPLAEMAAAAAGMFSGAIVDGLPFGLVLADAGGSPTVSVLVSPEQRSVRGAIHTETDAAIAWAEDYYARVHAQATDMTSDWLDAAPPTGSVALSAVADPGRVEREAEGFVKLTPEYFANRAAAPPPTAWRAGFDLVDVHAGYAIDRTNDRDRDEMELSLTDDLIAHLSDGDDHALIGAPGSGKSTVCKSVACQWYEQGRGAVFYRESGTGATFESPAILSAQLRATDGHALVVVEDAVRAEANTIFQVMRDFREDETVTFLLDARDGEWDDPTAFPRDARLDAYRTNVVETAPMPALDERDCERLVQHFQDTTAHEVEISIPSLLRDSTTKSGDETPPEQPRASQSAKLLVVLHRLTLHADPLAGEDARTPTTLTEDIQQTYAALHTDSDLALDVGVLVNLLNAAGLGVRPALVYALAETDEEVATIRSTLEALEDHLIFTREEDDPSYRTVHEAWSELFLGHLLVTANSSAASQRFGRCVSALLDLADNAARRERSKAAVGGVAPVIERIAAGPTEWADATTDQLFQLGEDTPRLAHLFGTTGCSPIEFPVACSPATKPRCVVRRGCMYRTNGNHEQAERNFTRALQLVEITDANKTVQFHRVTARSQLNLGVVAFRRGDLETAVEFFTCASASYREVSDRRGEADCQGNLGIVAGERGNLDQATEYLERGLTIHRETGAAGVKRIMSLNNLAKVATLRGDFDSAETYLEQSITIGRDLDTQFHLSLSLTNLGTITQKRDDLAQAEDYCNQAITLAQDAGFRLGKAGGLFGLAEIDIERGNLDQAAEYVQRGLDIYREIKEKRRRALGQCHLGSIARKREKFDEAETHLTTALTLARDGDSRYKEAKTLVALGDFAHDRDDPERARERFASAVEIYRDMGAVRDVIETVERLAKICEVLDEEEAALTHYEAAAALVEETEFIDRRESLADRHAQLTAHLTNDTDRTGEE